MNKKIEFFLKRMTKLIPNYTENYPNALITQNDIAEFFIETIHSEFAWSRYWFNKYPNENSDDFSEKNAREFINLIQLLGEFNEWSNFSFEWQDLLDGR
ncbi:hypothetical protein WOSG25_110140 [Weissella oryzae SG25]|uniref:Uncharacterized protein n=1 Tax=Weissella oryzae (strain DSM 25784 / JCM 18191 / LMG 30913 / SG25) TaxID=1329250 RepID=A0A069D298_WEIOS|nr:hypothetical protein [Weissella oryzae]GAK31536.1 hypothetical protein WOSG25_110140 [Weissella oryzae SG25]